MKKVLILDKGALAEWYGQAAPDGSALRCRRLLQCGRLELLQVTNDPPSYWFVMIRNFDQRDQGKDRKALKGLTTPWGNGVWRFLDLKKARAKFDKLAKLPIFVTEAQEFQRRRDKARERILKAGTAFKKKPEPLTA
jgi:hypothetical protein